MNARILEISGVVVLTVACLVSTAARARELTFDERVRAQEAIERVYYSHQIGATKPFEQAVPWELLERKVRTCLKQSIALEKYWSTPVTAAMLGAELDRIFRDTRLPERLGEIRSALGEGRFLLEEVLARQVLVDRMSRSFFDYDSRFHSDERHEAERIVSRLARGELDPSLPHRNRSVVEVVSKSAARNPSPETLSLRRGNTLRTELPPEQYARWRKELPETPIEVSPVREERDHFTVRVVLAEGPGWTKVASYVIPKRHWKDWWDEIEGGLDEREVRTVSSASSNVSVASAHFPTDRFAPESSASDRQEGRVGTCTPDDTWDNGILDDPPDRRAAHKAVWTGTLMLVWGGSREGHPLKTGARYDPLTDTWSPMTTQGAPSPRSEHTAVWTGRYMVIWGGFDAYYLGSGGRYDPATDTWTPTSIAGAPHARAGHTAVWTGSRMVVWGGKYIDFVTVPLDTGGRYDPDTDTWQVTSTVNVPTARFEHTAVWTGREMLIWGGDNGVSYTDPYLNTGGRYDPVLDLWAPMSVEGAPSARAVPTAIWTGQWMIVWGGRDGPTLNTGGRYDPELDTWTATAISGAPAARRSHSAIWTGSRMVIWGGTGTSIFNNGGLYDPSQDAWQPTSLTNGPEGRTVHTAVWTGSLMVVWGGGLADGTGTDTGGRYDPVADSWTPTSTTGSPSPRSGPSAVWTGTVMVVWGGIGEGGPGGYLNTGGRYDPLTDSWSPTSTLGVTEPRAQHATVWTGSEMIVWGGDGYTEWSTLLNTGGRYDPVSDTWKPMTTTGAPARRDLHTGVWTGSHLVVWGGMDGSLVYATGGRYDPQLDSWAPTATLGAPQARIYHTAVWGGQRMIVWGGRTKFANGVPLSTGGRYDPATDSWSPTSAQGQAPVPRDRHSAVWTGSEMVIWGGLGCTSDGSACDVYLDTGGRYDPAGDSWTQTSLLNAPPPRSVHGAVWMDGMMAVWGGGDGQFRFERGGRYAIGNPDADTDGTADACDCAPIDPGAFHVPGEVAGLTLGADKITLSWESAAPGAGTGTVHDVPRGMLGELPVGSGVSETCMASAIAASTTTDMLIPAEGNGFWYLVRGRNVCGAGTYGSRSDGAQRTTAVCP